MSDPMKPTMTLAEYVKAEAEDGNLFWRLPTGDHLNLLDAALEEIETLRAKCRLLEADLAFHIGWREEITRKLL